MVSPQHRSDKSTAKSHVMPGQLMGPGEAAGTFFLARARRSAARVTVVATVRTRGFGEHTATWN